MPKGGTQPKIKVGNELISKTELVRRVLAMNPTERTYLVAARIKREYGVEVAQNTVSQVRGKFNFSPEAPKKSVQEVKTPVVETPVVETPVVETPVVETPAKLRSSVVEGLVKLKEVIEILGKDATREIIDILVP